MKDTAGVGVELKQIYLSGRRSHHPNDAPRPTKPNPNYRAEEPDPLPSRRRSSRWRERRSARTPAEIGQKRITSLIAWRLDQGAKTFRVGTQLRLFLEAQCFQNQSIAKPNYFIVRLKRSGHQYDKKTAVLKNISAFETAICNASNTSN